MKTVLFWDNKDFWIQQMGERRDFHHVIHVTLTWRHWQPRVSAVTGRSSVG